MARGESPYQGRYNVPIHDYSPMVQGGAAWGQAYKDVGASIGAGIEKYGLKKEKQKENKGKIKGLIATVETLKRTDTSDSSMVYDSALARLKDEDIPLASRVSEGEEIVKGINFSTTIQNRQMSTEQMKLANELSTKVQHLRVSNLELSNETARLNQTGQRVRNDLSKIDLKNLPEKTRLLLEKLQAELGAGKAAEARAEELHPGVKALQGVQQKAAKQGIALREAAAAREKELHSGVLAQQGATLAKTKAETAKLTWEVQGKPVVVTPLQYTHPTTGEVITDQTHGYGKGNTLLYKQVQADGKTVRLHTIGTAADSLDAKAKYKDYHLKAIESLENEFAFRREEIDLLDNDEYDFSIKTLDMVLTRGTYSDDGKTVSHSWDSADGKEFDVEDWKSLEEMENGTAKEKVLADKIHALRRHREEMWKFPETQSGPDGNRDLTDREVRDNLRRNFSR